MKVSIIIPCYNSEKYVLSCLESCLRQNYDDLEVIVVDDGSDDNTCDVVRGLSDADSRIILLQSDHNGACRARNIGFDASSGSLIKFLDSDDYLVDGIIADQASRSSDASRITFGYVVAVKEDGGQLRHDRYPAIDGEAVDLLTILRLAPPTATPLFPREAVAAVGGYNEKVIRAQDYEFHVRVALAGYQFVYSGKPVYFRRIHGSPHRISNKLPANPVAFIEPLLDLVAKVDELNDAASSSQVRTRLAKLSWKTGRRFMRNGDSKSAQAMWALSKELHGRNYLSGKMVYRLLYHIFGPELAESLNLRTRMRIATGRLFGRTS